MKSISKDFGEFGESHNPINPTKELQRLSLSLVDTNFQELVNQWETKFKTILGF